MRLFGLDISRSERRNTSPENPAVSLSDPSAFRQLFGSWISAAGVDVTIESALGVPAVWCAVNFIASTIASLPLHEYRVGENGRERVDTGTLSSILTTTVNDDVLTSFEWRKNLMVSTLLTGAGRTYVERNAARQPVNLWPIETARTTRRRVSGRTVYEYRDNAGPVINYGAPDVIDITWLAKLDGVSHFNPLERFRDSFGLAIALERYASKFFQNGGVPPLALSAPVGSPGAMARGKSDVEKQVRDANAKGDPILYMPIGTELKPIGFDPEKGQLIEAQRFCIEQIARIFDLPPVFLQDLTHGTFSNTEQQDLHFVKHTLTQWVELWEQQLNAKLYGPRSTGRYVEFELDGLLRGDFRTRMEGWARGVQTGLVMPNEARRAENRPDAPGGDRLYIQGATVPLEMAGKIPLTPAPATDPAADPSQNQSGDAANVA
jgi:HK97 family phage portal protein